MILIINVCSEKLHYYEFVKPVEDILKEKHFFAKHYLDLSEDDLKKASKIIICGTSLKDDFFIKNIEKFSWLLNFKKPVLGICAGMQIIGLVFGGKLKKKKEIGFFQENFRKGFLGIKSKQEVYHLHKNYIEFPSSFEIFSSSKIAQAVRFKNFFGVLFHPEVRQKKIIEEFIR